jgi:inositol phosphorylceramide mannosyltransferase catalytic subunit
MLIPRIFHQIWVGPEPFPEEYARYQQTWLAHHPGWELRFWTEDGLPDGLRRPEAAERLRTPAERADILRLEVLWRFGGVYVDTDIESLRPLEPLIADAELFIGLAKPGRVNNALLGAVAEHPLLDRALDELTPREFYGYDKDAAGPKFLDRLLLGEPGVVLIDPEVFYPQTPAAEQSAYTVHHMARSWKDPEQLRRDVVRWETKARETRESAEKWRARYDEAQAELVRHRRSWPRRLAALARKARPGA